jgi:hypothetical protein
VACSTTTPRTAPTSPYTALPLHSLSLSLLLFLWTAVA